MAFSKNLTYDKAALFLSPGLPVRVSCAGRWDLFHVGATGGDLPAVPKVQGLYSLSKVSCAKIVVGISIIVSTQATNMTLLE